jgi:hypothetical protein
MATPSNGITPEGPGWTREVLRHRSNRDPASNTTPRSTP